MSDGEAVEGARLHAGRGDLLLLHARAHEHALLHKRHIGTPDTCVHAADAQKVSAQWMGEMGGRGGGNEARQWTSNQPGPLRGTRRTPSSPGGPPHTTFRQVTAFSRGFFPGDAGQRAALRARAREPQVRVARPGPAGPSGRLGCAGFAADGPACEGSIRVEAGQARRGRLGSALGACRVEAPLANNSLAFPRKEI